MASSPSSPMKEDEDKLINWEKLPSELTYSILLRLSAVEILESAQKVCISWRRISKDPSMWRKIDLQDVRNKFNKIGRPVLYNNIRVWSISDADMRMFDQKINSIFGQAVDRSEGCLEEINLGNIGTHSMLNYIANRSSNLRSLTIGYGPELITNERLVSAFVKLPLLEELEFSRIGSQLDLKAIGHSCPHLKTLKLNCICFFSDIFYPHSGDDYALEIAESMPQLRHLQLFGSKLTDIGLNAILDNCSHLQHLDLRGCFNVELVGDLEKRCIERIKHLRRPDDSFDDIQFDLTYLEEDDEDDDFD